MSFNILVADDSETVRAVIARTLALAGVPVGALHRAGNGREALETLKGTPVDLVFSDLNMPVMTGVELIESMQANDALRSIPVVVMSEEGSRTRINDLIQKGVRAYLRKPFTPEAVKAIVESVLGEQHA